MRSVYVDHVCGHTKLHSIRDESRAAWLARQLCIECYRNRKTAEGQRVADGLGLPEITNGNPNGIAWAEGIRGKFFSSVWGWIDESTSKGEMTPAQGERIRQAILAKAATMDDCGWWIRNKENLKRNRSMWGLFFLNPETRKELSRIHMAERKEARKC